MRNKSILKKLVKSALVSLSLVAVSGTVYAHPGRLDSNGGHHDYKNVSGLGGYHYHCGDYPAHLHPNGVCQYTGTSKPNTNGGGTGSTGNTPTVTKVAVYIDNVLLEQNKDTGEAYITNSRVLLPTRQVSQGLGFNVDWNNTAKKATVTDGKSSIVLTLNSKIAVVNGSQKQMDVALSQKDGRIYVPVRFVSEALNRSVEYQNKTVYISK